MITIDRKIRPAKPTEPLPTVTVTLPQELYDRLVRWTGRTNPEAFIRLCVERCLDADETITDR